MIDVDDRYHDFVVSFMHKEINGRDDYLNLSEDKQQELFMMFEDEPRFQIKARL